MTTNERLLEEAGEALSVWDAETADMLNQEARVFMAMGYRTAELTIHADREYGRFMVVPRSAVEGRGS